MRYFLPFRTPDVAELGDPVWAAWSTVVETGHSLLPSLREPEWTGDLVVQHPVLLQCGWIRLHSEG